MLLISGCNKPSQPRVLVIQPFEDVEHKTTEILKQQLSPIFFKVIVYPRSSLPESAFYTPRQRYRADSIIHQFKHSTAGDTVLLAITHKDISTTKGQNKDWGVMGLALSPGKSCVISDFRTGKYNSQAYLYKLALHELGHTEGLPHCKENSCYLRSAEGKNHLDQLHDFCKNCKKYLRNKGWNLR